MTNQIIIIPERPEAGFAARNLMPGPYGHLLRTQLKDAGIVDYVITPLFNDRHPKTHEETLKAFDELAFRLSLSSACVLVPLSNLALFALARLGKVDKEIASLCQVSAKDMVDITKLRGSVYEWQGRKVIPTLSTKACINCGYSPNFNARTRIDWEFIAKESEFAEIHTRKEDFYYSDDDEQLITAVVRDMLASGRKLALDIENWTGRKVDCLGVADSPERAVSIQLTDKTRPWALPLIRKVCESSNEKIFQNGYYYDVPEIDKLLRFNINNYLWDTLAMHHALDPAETHSLEFLASIYTHPRLNYWKDESDGGHAGRKLTEKSLRYNCKDVTATWEICDRLQKLLREEGLLGFYFKHYMSLFKPMAAVSRLGFRVDNVAQEKYRIHILTEMRNIRKQLSRYLGYDIYASKDFSPVALRDLVINVLGLPLTYTRDGRETLDEEALLRLAQKHKKRSGGVLDLILHHRTLAAELKYLRTYDFDGRVRTRFGFAYSGRLTSGTSPHGAGANLQNIKRPS